MDSVFVNELLFICTILGIPCLVIYAIHLKLRLSKQQSELWAAQADIAIWRERYEKANRDINTYEDIIGVTLTSNTRLGQELLDARKELAQLRPVVVTDEERHISQTAQPRKLVRLQEHTDE